MAGGMGKILKQAQKMQQEMERVQAELATREVTVSVGGGAVEVVATCDNRIKAIAIKPEAVDPDDVEMLQDLIVAGVNQALDETTAITATEMARVTAGLGGPGGLGGMMGGLPGL
jgi:DNA-binding YbaB/EbfC family protein